MADDNFNILVWNVRGLNARARRDTLRVVAGLANAAIVCLQETKLRDISPFMVSEMLGARFTSYVYLPTAGVRGGILLACRGPEFACTPLSVGQFSVTARITVGANLRTWVLTSVYGPQPEEDKVEFLDELRAIKPTISCPWAIAGDFNLLLHATDKNKTNINRRNMGRFRRFVDELQLKDQPLHGRRYT